MSRSCDAGLPVSSCWGPADSGACASLSGQSRRAHRRYLRFGEGRRECRAHAHVDLGWDQGEAPRRRQHTRCLHLLHPRLPPFTGGHAERTGDGLRSHRRWPGSGATWSRAPVSLQTLWVPPAAMPTWGRWARVPLSHGRFLPAEASLTRRSSQGLWADGTAFPPSAGASGAREPALHGPVMSCLWGALSFCRGQRTSLSQPGLTVPTGRSQPFSTPGLAPGGRAGPLPAMCRGWVGSGRQLCAQ